MKDKTNLIQIVFLAFLGVFLLSSILLIAVGAPFLEPYIQVIRGSLGSWARIARVIKVWIPLTLCSCGLLYAFRIGLWNIGVEGQVIMGAIFSTAVLRSAGTGPPILFLVIAVIAGVMGGGLWAVVSGFLKIKGGVNEIFAGLGLNFLAQGVIIWLIFGPWKRPGIASMSGTELFQRRLWLSEMSWFRIPLAGLVLAIVSITLTAAILKYTKAGLALKAIGKNPRASLLFGLKPGKYMIVSLFFAGGLAGIAGTFQAAGIYHRLIPAISSNYGYLALLVVMLANYNVWLSPVIAFFFACLNVGSIQLPMALGLDSSLAGVLQGAMVLAALGAHAMRNKKVRG